MNSIKKFLKNLIHKHERIYSFYKFPKFRYLTSPIRSLPDFIIIGVQKCGTTSLYDMICKHPGVIPVKAKEIHYFSTPKYGENNWYRLHFPTNLEKWILGKRLHHKVITGEATPTYIFHSKSIKRIKKLLPKVKLIVILRNPVDRAYSHYNHNVKRNFENYSFEEAIKEKRVIGGEDKFYDDKFSDYNTFSYLLKGKYADQLEEWFQDFEMQQVLILSYEEFKENPDKVLGKIFYFLGLPQCTLDNIARLNVGKYNKMNPNTRNFLVSYFKLHNEKLYKLLKRKFDWDK